MRYLFTDMPFRNRVFRFIRHEDGDLDLSDGLLEVLKQTQEENQTIITVIMGHHDLYHLWRTHEEKILWQEFNEELGLYSRASYDWTRASGEATPSG